MIQTNQSRDTLDLPPLKNPIQAPYSIQFAAPSSSRGSHTFGVFLLNKSLEWSLLCGMIGSLDWSPAVTLLLEQSLAVANFHRGWEELLTLSGKTLPQWRRSSTIWEWTEQSCNIFVLWTLPQQSRVVTPALGLPFPAAELQCLQWLCGIHWLLNTWIHFHLSSTNYIYKLWGWCGSGKGVCSALNSLRIITKNPKMSLKRRCF